MPEKCRWIYTSGKNKGSNCKKNGIHDGWCNDHKVNGPLKQANNPPPASEEAPVEYTEEQPVGEEEYDEAELAELNDIMGEPEGEYEDTVDFGQSYEEPIDEDLAPMPSTLGSELQAKAKKEITKKEKMKKVDAKAKELKKIESIKKTAAKLKDPKLMKEVEQVEQMKDETDELEELGDPEDLPFLDEGMDPAQMSINEEIRRKEEAAIRAINRLAPAVPMTIETAWTAVVEPRSGVSMRGLYKNCMEDEDVKRDLQEAFFDCLDEFGLIKRDDVRNLPASTRLMISMGGVMMMTANDNAAKTSKANLSEDSKRLGDQLDD